MLSFLGGLVALAFLTYLILAVIATRKKNGTAKKKWLITLGLFILASVLGNANTPTVQETADINLQEDQNNLASTEIKNNKETSTSAIKPQQDNSKVNSKQTNKKASDSMLSKEEVLAYTDNLTGRTFIKNVEVGKTNIDIQFYKNYKAYKADNTASRVTEEDYINYFATGDQINKLLMQESTRLFKQFPATQKVKMNLPFEGKTYSIDITKDKAEQFYNVSFDHMRENDTWNKQISDVFFNKNDRENFVNTFVIVQ